MYRKIGFNNKNLVKSNISIVLIAILMLIGLSGCKDDSLSKKAIDQGKLAIADMEYTKALSSFELAIDEGSEDKEVKDIIEIIEKFNESKKLLDEGNAEEAEDILDSINEDYKQYSIKRDIDILKEELDSIKKNNIALKENLDNIDELIDEGKYEDAKVEIEDILNDDKNIFDKGKKEINKKLELIEKELLKNKNKEEGKKSDLEINNKVKSYSKTIEEINYLLSLKKEDIRKIYGEPKEIDLHSGGDYWAYGEKTIYFRFTDYETGEAEDVSSIDIKNLRDIFGIEGDITQETLKKVFGKPEFEGIDHENDSEGYVIFYERENLHFYFADIGKSGSYVFIKEAD